MSVERIMCFECNGYMQVWGTCECYQDATTWAQDNYFIHTGTPNIYKLCGPTRFQGTYIKMHFIDRFGARQWKRFERNKKYVDINSVIYYDKLDIMYRNLRIKGLLDEKTTAIEAVTKGILGNADVDGVIRRLFAQVLLDGI